MLRPGETVHYVSLLNEAGETILTIPMDNPPAVPKDESIIGADVFVNIDVKLKIRGYGSQ